MTFLVFWDQDRPDHALAWRDQVTGEEGGETLLAEVAARLGPDSRTTVCAVIPGEGVMTRALSLPMKRERDLKRAAILGLEDQVALAVPDPHYGFGPPTDGVRRVSVCPRSLLEEALDAFLEAGLDPDQMTADHALLPPRGDGSRLDRGERSAVRTENAGFTAEADFIDDLFAGREIEKVTLADLLDPGDAPDFRVGVLAKRSPLPDLRSYALAASLAFVAFVLWLTSMGIEGARYASAASGLRADAEAAFREANPGTPIIDLERQLRGRAQDRSGSDFLVLAASLAEVLADQETTFLSSINYTDDGELTAELTLAAFDDLESITAALSSHGVDVRQGNDARLEEGAYVTRLFLRAA